MLLAGGMIFVFISYFFPLTHSASYSNMPIEQFETDNLKLINHIIQPNLQTYELNLEFEYVLSGTILYDTITNVTLTLKPINGQGIVIHSIQTNRPFQINGLFAYMNHIPREYTVTITLDKENTYYGTIRIGGLLTGKYIQLGIIPVIQAEKNIKGKIRGKVSKAEDNSSINKNVTVYLIEGMSAYPFTEIDAFSSEKEFTPIGFKYTAICDSNGLFIFPDIHQGYYTIIVSHSDYYIEKTHVSINASKDVVELSLFLIPRLTKRKIKIALEWPKAPQDLDLSIVMVSNNTVQCIVGYMNNNCGNVNFITQSNKGGSEGVEMIEIDYLSNYTYIVYVNKYKNLQEGFVTTHFAPGFMTEDKIMIDIEDIQLSESHAKVKLYVPEYKFALVNANVPTSINGDEWKVFDINGLSGIGEITVY